MAAGLLLACLAGVGLESTAASPSAASEPPALVRVTAVVTDRRGQVPRNLKPADFEIVVDGQPQTIDTVEYSAGVTAARTVVFLLDEFHTAAGACAM